MARLGDVCNILNGYAFKSEQYVANGIRIIRIANVQKGFIEDSNPVFYPSDSIEVAKYSLSAGDLLMSLTGNVGRVAILSSEFLPAALNQRVACLKIKPNKELDKAFLFHLLNSDYFEQRCIEASKGVAQKNMSTEWLKDYEIPLFPIEVQYRIVAVLDKVSDLITLRKQQLAKLDELVKSRFIELFGDPDMNPLKWDEVLLGDHLDIIGGYAFKSDGFLDEGIPVLRIGNINSGHFMPVNMVFWHDDPQLTRYKMYPGDLVMSLTGTVGKDDYGNVCILGAEFPEYFLNQRNAKLELKHTIDKRYLAELLKFTRIKKRLTGISRGVRQANIANKDIANLRIPIPPIDMQRQFTAFVEQTDKSKSAIQQSLEKLETLKKALMQKYFG